MACDGAADIPYAAPDQAGPFAVGHDVFSATDPARGDREIQVDVWYPSDASASGAQRSDYPLIGGLGIESEVATDDLPPRDQRDQTLVVFSHGYNAINVQSLTLVETLAGHGFVVAAPVHVGNAQGTTDSTFDEAAANRVPDVTLTIDTMLARAEYRDILDPSRIAVVGHSFGGMTAIGAASGWAGAAPDSRVQAIVPISAVIRKDLQETRRTSDNAGFTPAQLAAIEVPVLLMGGTQDQDVPIENNDIAFAELTDAPAVYKVEIVGATHTHFANVCDFAGLLLELGFERDDWDVLGAGDLKEPYDETCGPDALPIAEAERLQNLYVVAFLRRHLWGDRAYEEFLTPAYAATEPLVNFARVVGGR